MPVIPDGVTPGAAVVPDVDEPEPELDVAGVDAGVLPVPEVAVVCFVVAKWENERMKGRCAMECENSNVHKMTLTTCGSCACLYIQHHAFW